MTRVYHQRPRQGAYGSSTLDRTRVARKKKPYKVIMEVVTQEKKKLHSVMTYTANAPTGYTFVPLGNRDLTEYCKERCRKRNLTAHIVSAKPKGKAHGDPEKEAPRIDTQRIGHHFPNEIIDEACDVLGYFFRNGVFQKSSRNYEETQLARSLHNYGQRMRLHGRPATETETKGQIRGAILEVFPKVPEADLNAIVDHAFEEGTNRVGNAKELTLARRVQLAVGAYIRHQYTDYDKILKTGGSWSDARSRAQPLSYAKLREWRDEADNSNELEETFREIIVLDDEDEDDDDSETSEDTAFGTDERGQSLEIISSRATARELQPDDTVVAPRADAYSVSRMPRRMIFLQPMHHARGSAAYPPRQVVRELPRPSLPTPMIARPPPPSDVPYQVPAPHRPISTALEPVARAPPPPRYFRDRDGKLYNLQPIEQPARSGPPVVEYPSSSRSTPRIISLDDYHTNRSAPLPPSRRPSGDDVVLPSIEREPEIIASPRRMGDNPHAHRFEHNPFSQDYPSVREPEVHSPQKRTFPAHHLVPDNRDRHPEQVSKRPRPAHYNEVVQSHPTHTSMFHRLHDREVFDNHSRPRMQSSREVIDLTSSPVRPSESSRDVYVLPRSYAAVAPPRHSYVPDSRPEEHRVGERYAPRHYYDKPMEALPHAHITEGGRYTRSNLNYDAPVLQ